MSTESVIEIPLGKLRCQKQIREDFAEAPLEGLASSLKDLKQIIPIIVYPEADAFVIEDGERRFRAAKLAGLATLKAIVKQPNQDEAELLMRQLVVNCEREDLSPMERARGLQQLIALHGGNATKVSQRSGIPKATISQLLKLLTLDPAIQAKVDTGEISRSAAYELAAVVNPAEQKELATKIAAKQMTREQVKARSESASKSVTSTPRIALPISESMQLTINAVEPSISSVVQAVEAFISKAKKAIKEGLEIDTLARMLRDQINVARKGETPNA